TGSIGDRTLDGRPGEFEVATEAAKGGHANAAVSAMEGRTKPREALAAQRQRERLALGTRPAVARHHPLATRPALAAHYGSSHEALATERHRGGVALATHRGGQAARYGNSGGQHSGRSANGGY